MSEAHPSFENSRSTGAPWTLIALAGVATLAVATAGLNLTVVAAGAAVQIVFMIYFLRHLSFVVGACQSAPTDLEQPQADDGWRPPVSVLVACHNEQAVVERLAEALLALEYPKDLLQILIVDDGSEDSTGELLDQLAADSDRLEVMHRPAGAGGGKSGALNSAISWLTGDFVVVFDADHDPAPDCVSRLVRHFSDDAVGSVQGRCVIRNAGDSIISRLVAVDYLAGYLVNEYGRQSVFSAPAYGGANCAVRTSSLKELGGWNVDSVTEDTDLTLRLLLRGERVRYDINAVDLEEGVTTLGAYWRQRYRWAHGHQQVCRDYRGAVLRSDRLGPAQKIETMLFLHSFHVPVLAAAGLIVLALWSAGLTQPVDPLGGFVLWTLLFIGPLLELGTGLLIAQRPRRDAITIVMFLPLFFVAMALSAKAWFDGVSGTKYSWSKTGRAGDAMAEMAEMQGGGMNRNLRTMLVMGALLVTVTIGFSHFNEAFRLKEAMIASRIMNFLLPSSEVSTAGTEMILQPRHGSFIVARLAPSCSALSSMLAIACLGLITPRRLASPARPRAAAITTAIAVVVIGNMVRITASLAAGVFGGTDALVLFHDVAGAFFTFVAIILGYTLFLAILLPKEQGETSLLPKALRETSQPEVHHRVLA